MLCALGGPICQLWIRNNIVSPSSNTSGGERRFGLGANKCKAMVSMSGAHRMITKSARPTWQMKGTFLAGMPPPETGHPGADYNCRCQAIPYVPGETEFAFHTMSELETSSSYRWIDLDFMAHYYYGNGTAVTLSEIGHLRDIAEQYAYADGKEGAFRRLSDQIADEARKVRSGSIALPFDDSYDFGSVQFSHGGGVVKGTFDGTVANDGGMLRIAGRSFFAFSDQFADPLGLGIEVGGVPYDITGVWSATFLAEVLLNAESSHFTVREAE